jgi:DNA-directed RNA polymerases I, II, and III subunit RPABC2
MENEDYVPSDIEDNEDDDASIEQPTNPIKKVLPVNDDEDVNEDEVDDDEDVEDSEVESDGDDFENIDDEDDIINRIQKDENTTTMTNNFMIDDEDDDDDADDDDDYLQKINDSTKHDIIANFHPELYSHNDDEIQTLSRVVRDDNGTIIDALHKTLPFITRYEKARILGERAKQLNSGAKSFVEVDDNVIDGYLIALKEFEEKKIPFIIKRPLPNGGCEYWKAADLEILV